MPSTLLCASNCGTTEKPPQTYHKSCDQNAFRTYGYPHFALISCNVAIPDPNDIAQWTALCASGDIAISPKGILSIPAPDQTTGIIDACGSEEVLETTYKLNFETHQATKLEDCKYFYEFLKNHKNYRIIFFDCDGMVTLTSEYLDFVDGTTTTAPTGSPGYEFTVSRVPHPEEGQGRKVKWTFEASVRFSGTDMLCYTEIPGLLPALQSC